MPLILAAAVWEVVVGVIFFVLYGIGQLLSARESIKKKPVEQKRPARPPAKQAAEGRPLAPQPVGQEESLRREVEDFLRRAQGKPPQQERASSPPRKPKPQRTPPPQPEGGLRHEGVAEHVAKHISSKQLVEHAEKLGDEVALADDRLESRLHQRFDHQVGSLQRREESTAPPGKEKEKGAAAEIAAMMRSPQGMRQLILAQEILRRPEL